MPRQGHHVPRRKRLARILYLEIAEPEVVEGPERFLSTALHIGVAHVGVLRAPQYRDITGGVEEVPGSHHDESFRNAMVKGDGRYCGVHAPEVGHVRSRC